MLLAVVRPLRREAFRPRPVSPRRAKPSRLRVEEFEERAVPTTLTVDDNGPANFTTITGAVAAALPGDTIKVAPGTYNEAVVVNKARLFLQGSFNADLALAQRAGPGATPAKDSIVDAPGPNLAAFTVAADRVTITGFSVRNAAGDDDSVGVTFQGGFSGAVVTNNAITQQSIGMFLASNGFVQTRVQGNAFVANNETGAAGGTGIYSDTGVSNTLVAGNYFTGGLNAAMNFASPTSGQQTNLTIRSNTLLHDGPIILTNVTDSTVAMNRSEDSNGSGIFFGGGVSNVRVTNNTLREGDFTGINLRNIYSGTPNTNNIIRGNFVSGFRDGGIRIRDGSTFNFVENNTVRNIGYAADPGYAGYGISIEDSNNNTVRGNSSNGGTRFGIFVTNASSNTIRGNETYNNSADGIRVENGPGGSSANNFFRGNHSYGNLSFDANDLTAGGGTGGTANTWQFNSLTVKNPTGLA